MADYPTAIKLVEEYESNIEGSRFRVAPIHPKDAPDFEQAAFSDEYGIPVREDHTELLQLINLALKKLRSVDSELYREMFERHQERDRGRYAEAPFELDW